MFQFISQYILRWVWRRIIFSLSHLTQLSSKRIANTEHEHTNLSSAIRWKLIYHTFFNSPTFEITFLHVFIKKLLIALFRVWILSWEWIHHNRESSLKIFLSHFSSLVRDFSWFLMYFCAFRLKIIIVELVKDFLMNFDV